MSHTEEVVEYKTSRRCKCEAPTALILLSSKKLERTKNHRRCKVTMVFKAVDIGSKYFYLYISIICTIQAFA